MEKEHARGLRKPRSDKGTIMATRRDRFCIAWIAEQYAVRFDQIQRLLSRFPDPNKPFKRGSLIAETTTRDQISRWQRAGWIEYKRVLADGRGYASCTRKGLQLVDLDGIYTAKAPAATRLTHLYAINQLRLWMDFKGYEWTSERRYRAELETAKKNESTGPIPDAVIVTQKGTTIAIEVELTPKKPDDLVNKLVQLVRAMGPAPDSYGYRKKFPLIWFYVPNEAMKRAVENARERLYEDDQDRISVAIEADLIV